jgi:HAD superfamily hydrolase (TIGR01458 family)
MVGLDSAPSSAQDDRMVDGLLIDIDGVLTVGWQPLAGAPEAFEELRRRGVPLRMLTNTTTRTRADIAELLTAAGFAVVVDDILTAPAATAAYLRTHHPGARCFVLSSGDLGDDLAGIGIAGLDEEADVVVLGGAGLVYAHEQLNHAFGLLLGGAAFVAMHRNLYWRTAHGLELDTGAYVTALEAATGVEPVVVGKPAPAFFEAGIRALDLPPRRVAMVGDDIENDVLGAQALGLRGILVRTGKFRAEAVAAAAGEPDVVVDSFADVPDLLDRVSDPDRRA